MKTQHIRMCVTVLKQRPRGATQLSQVLTAQLHLATVRVRDIQRPQAEGLALHLAPPNGKGRGPVKVPGHWAAAARLFLLCL